MPCAIVAGLELAPADALAGPWAEVGDAQLRSDIEILAAAGVIDNITGQWPLPWDDILDRLDAPGALDEQPAFVVAAAQRVAERGRADIRTGPPKFSFSADLTNAPALVRGFDALGRQDETGQVAMEVSDGDTSLRIALGARSAVHGDRQTFVADGSYIAQKVGGAQLYAGYLTHWWGPGWISSLPLSNNARPFPQVGIARTGTSAFGTPWLSWLGPWQAEFFIGVLDGPRVAQNTLYDGLRVSFNPLPGLEIGISRNDELCGTGHPCKPLATWFDVRNDPAHPSRTNDELTFDFKYTGHIGNWPFEAYTQMMNEDSNPIVHSGTSHLFGASVWVPVRRSDIRLTAEYTDSNATQDIFSFGELLPGVTYNDGKYADGMRYRGRALGFSLDDDSRLASLQASWIGEWNVTYTLSYHHAVVSSPLSVGRNPLTTAPVTINIGEVRVSIPFSGVALDLAARIQDDQLRPDHGFTGAVEGALRVNL